MAAPPVVFRTSNFHLPTFLRWGCGLILGGSLGLSLLCWLKPPPQMQLNPWRPPGGETSSKLRRYFGPEFWPSIVGKVVVDYGCGDGPDALELVRAGAKRVIGIDLDERALEHARRRAEVAGVADRCVFTTHATSPADIVVSSDAFEHVADLPETLRRMDHLLAPGGVVWVSFGPPWYHPNGGHIFSVFPWAHLVFTERALTRWRSAFNAGSSITSFREAGLNQMSIRRFLQTVEQSPFAFDYLELVPIQKLRGLCLQRLPAARELVTALVKCRLVPRRRP